MAAVRLRVPREFFAAVRAELAERGVAPSPQTRDMNPIYTGKDVSYIDTKQANRAAEHAVLEAERFAAFAGLLAGATTPSAALAKAWVQLAYGAHHDAITGSESDQVYLDLLTGLARRVGTRPDGARQRADVAVQRRRDASVMVWNPLAHNRTDIVTIHLAQPVHPGARVVCDNGDDPAVLVTDGGHTLTWLARDVPSLGWRAYRPKHAHRVTAFRACHGVAGNHRADGRGAGGDHPKSIRRRIGRLKISAAGGKVELSSHHALLPGSSTASAPGAAGVAFESRQA